MPNSPVLLTPSLLLRAYESGIFPMADSAHSTALKWFEPPVRAIIPIDTFHVPRRLKRIIKHKPYQVTLNRCFRNVIQTCAEETKDRPETWINNEIIRLYTALHNRGHAHSIEVWKDKDLVGGLYGVSQGSAFFGESMFSKADNASKIALVYLVTLLHNTGCTLLDTQFQTEHLSQFGTIEIKREAYQERLEKALKTKKTIKEPEDWDQLVGSFLQPTTHKS